MNSDKEIIQELKKRGFKTDIFLDIGGSYFKEYKSEKYYYAIIVSFTGNVYLTNFDETVNDNTICLNDNIDFTNDLLYIIQNLKPAKKN